jgi:hypothetical protein
MKKVKVLINKNYKDVDLKRVVRKGETITVTDTRAEKIVGARFGTIVQVETNPLPKAAKATTKIKPKVLVEEVVIPDVKNGLPKIDATFVKGTPFFDKMQKAKEDKEVPKKKKSKSKDAKDSGKKD